MTIWEYTTERFSKKGTEYNSPWYWSLKQANEGRQWPLPDVLNYYGADGWELIYMSANQDYSEWVFKRPKN